MCNLAKPQFAFLPIREIMKLFYSSVIILVFACSYSPTNIYYKLFPLRIAVLNFEALTA